MVYKSSLLKWPIRFLTIKYCLKPALAVWLWPISIFLEIRRYEFLNSFQATVFQ